MRLIDADLVLGQIGCFTDRENGNEHFFNGLETAKELIDNAHTISHAAVWTPCAEGLPKEEYAANKNKKKYIVTTMDGHEELETTLATRRYYESYFDRDSGRVIAKEVFWYDEVNKHEIAAWNKKVVAWQHISPYRADDTTGKVKEDAEC